MSQRLNLDLDLLRSFVAVAESGAFTKASGLVFRTQSAISLQIKRLETLTGRRLFDRSPRHVRLTREGEALLAHAQEILRLNDDAVAALEKPNLSGLVRLGTPEDFATAHLPGVLAEFARTFSKVELQVTCDLTLNLMKSFREDSFDLVLVKQDPGQNSGGRSGTRVWREPLVWVAASREMAKTTPIPLAVSPEPCVYRKRALRALRSAGRASRIAYVCGSLQGTLAAVRAGLGVTVLPRGMADTGLTVIDDGRTLPDLADTAIALLSRPHLSAPAAKLADHIVRRLEGMAHSFM